jgi:glycerol-3-phosphate acyltransferase PlsY
LAWESIGWLGIIVAAYLIGSLPTANLAARWLKRQDIRTLGDRNAGAANAFRNLGARAGLTVGAVDIGKGAAAILLAKFVGGETALQMTAGLAAVVGHNWPFFLQFRGGRGAATTLGVFMGLLPMPGIPLSLGALLILALSKRATVALTFFFLAMPLVAWLTGAGIAFLGYVILLPVVVAIAHFASQRKIDKPQVQPEQCAGIPTPESQ